MTGSSLSSQSGFNLTENSEFLPLMNESRFKDCVMPLHKLLYAYALTILHDESDAEDCIQEAMTRLWENRDRLDKVDNVSAYATVTVRNIALTMSSKARYAVTTFGDDPPDLSDSSPSPAKIVEGKDDIRKMNLLIRGLPVNQRKVLTLSSIAGLSTAEIHQATGLSEDNVRVLISRARKKLRTLFYNT